MSRSLVRAALSFEDIETQQAADDLKRVRDLQPAFDRSATVLRLLRSESELPEQDSDEQLD